MNYMSVEDLSQLTPLQQFQQRYDECGRTLARIDTDDGTDLDLPDEPIRGHLRTSLLALQRNYSKLIAMYTPKIDCDVEDLV